MNVTIGPRLQRVLVLLLVVVLFVGLVALGANEIVERMLDMAGGQLME